MDRSRACGKCGKASVLFRGFSKQPWESVSRRSRRRPPDCFADFHGCGIFHRLFCFLFLFLFLLLTISLVENRPGRVTNNLPYWFDDWRRLSSAASSGSGTYAQMMSFEDSAIRIMGDSPPEGFHTGARRSEE